MLYFIALMMDEIKREKLATFCTKYHLNFLVLVFAVFGLNAILYELTAILPLTNHHLSMAIDDAIPFIPEFCFFYSLFYVSPLVFLYALAFYDKKKLLVILMDGAISVVLCFIVYCIYNVQMIRPEAAVEGYWFFDGSITNVHEFFLALVHFQYIVDPLARNGIPSLHAMFACLIFLSGCPMSKSEKHVPIVLRIFAIIFGIGVAVSTFFVKQHYFIDAVIGFALGFIMFFICKPIFSKIINKYPDNKKIKLLTED